MYQSWHFETPLDAKPGRAVRPCLAWCDTRMLGKLTRCSFTDTVKLGNPRSGVGQRALERSSSGLLGPAGPDGLGPGRSVGFERAGC